MKIEEFKAKYGHKSISIESLARHWVAQKEIHDFLNTPVMSGVLICDLLIGDSLGNRVEPDVLEEFAKVTVDNLDTAAKLQDTLIAKIKNDDGHVRALLNKMQGQIGKNAFIENMGSSVTLSDRSDQSGWDVQVDHGNYTQYVQVKVYKKAFKVIDKMKEVNDCIASGKLEGVTQVDFAVNSEIVDEVKQMVVKHNLPNKVIDIGASSDDLQTLVDNNFENIGNYSGLEHFFGEFLGATLSETAFHGVINGFFLWKGSKDKEQALEDTVYGSAVSAGGIAAALTIDEALAIISAPLGGALAMGVGIGARSVLTRVADRRFIVKRLQEGNEQLAGLITDKKL
ncbi:MAG: hypothetical protein ISR65_15830 [Bacteriovoracaceae bacterium]|nr:hypothetical protein [Bacteriovoracaceae bacterium]